MKDLYGICPFVTTQKILQGKWAILIMHHLSNRPTRFNELQRQMNIAQATLATQLKSLEKEGLIIRTIYPEVPPKVEYSLSKIGQEFSMVLFEIEKWGEKYISYLKDQK